MASKNNLKVGDTFIYNNGTRHSIDIVLSINNEKGIITFYYFENNSRYSNTIFEEKIDIYQNWLNTFKNKLTKC